MSNHERKPKGWHSRGYLPHLDVAGLLQFVTFHLADSLPKTIRGHPLPKVVQAWKSYSSKRVNRLLERTGTFWARDYFDRYVGDDQHLQAVVRYIEKNPVKAGLVDRPETWPFGSARRRKTE